MDLALSITIRCLSPYPGPGGEAQGWLVTDMARPEYIEKRTIWIDFDNLEL